MLTIQNEFIKVDINTAGAELDSIYHKQHQLEYLWNGDAAVWGKKSPILFPIVGTLTNNTYYFGDKSYELGRHGFAREKEFSVVDQAEKSVSLSLKSSEETLERYPFAFELIITYTVWENSLSVNYKVVNSDNKLMYFSIGGHPAFKVPLVDNSAYEDYYLEFDRPETAGRWPISPDGLIEPLPTPLLENTNRLPITRELFAKDAVVFKHLASHQVSLKTDKSEHGLTFDFVGFPYLGIWAAKNGDFVCIEPWYGIADSVTATQQLAEKEGVLKLEPEASFEAKWNVQLF